MMLTCILMVEYLDGSLGEHVKGGLFYSGKKAHGRLQTLAPAVASTGDW